MPRRGEDECVVEVWRCPLPAPIGDPLCESVLPALILGKAGLLRGRRAMTHHLRLEGTPGEYGAIPENRRVVVNGRIVTSAGISASKDLGLTLGGNAARRGAEG